MLISAVIGNESHTTSRGWAKLSINGKPVTWREAISKEWQTKYGDKHSSWCECVFKVEPGQVVQWEAGTNSGNRGRNQERLNLRLVADEDAPSYTTPDLGYPARGAVLEGKLRLVEDINESKAELHERLRESV